MTMPRHILHVITAIGRGGAENHLFELVRHQRAQGYEVTVGYLRPYGYWAEAFRELGVEVHDFGLRFYGDLWPLRRLRQVIDGASFDLVHAHLPPAELYARLALVGRRLPLIITKHNVEPFYRGPGEKSLGRWVASRASAVIAISNSVNDYMAGPSLGIPRGKLHTIYYGIDAQPFGKANGRLRAEWGVPQETMLVGFVGRLVPQKNIEMLLRGLALVDARLVIVGEGPLEAALRREADRLGIAGRVIWAGFSEDISAVMQAFDIFALTSNYEGFGLVLLEAMAAGRPVVATRVSAIPEVVVNGETGLLVPPDDPDALAEALRKLADPVTRQQLGRAGRRRVLENFTLEKMSESTDALYRRVRRVEPIEHARTICHSEVR